MMPPHSSQITEIHLTPLRCTSTTQQIWIDPTHQKAIAQPVMNIRRTLNYAVTANYLSTTNAFYLSHTASLMKPTTSVSTAIGNIIPALLSQTNSLNHQSPTRMNRAPFGGHPQAHLHTPDPLPLWVTSTLMMSLIRETTPPTPNPSLPMIPLYHQLEKLSNLNHYDPNRPSRHASQVRGSHRKRLGIILNPRTRSKRTTTNSDNNQ